MKAVIFMDIIKSKDNSKIKYVRFLNRKKGRDLANAFMVEGIKFVNEAIRENSHIELLVFCKSAFDKKEIGELYSYSMNTGIEAIICEDRVFDSISNTIHAQGVLAVVKKKAHINYIGTGKFVVMCDRIQDPGNLGTIIRTADAFGPAAVILNGGCVDAYNSKTVRATAGAIFRVPVVYENSDVGIINKLRSFGYKIISTVVDSEYFFDDVEKSEKICVVIGNEGRGVSLEIQNNSDMNITIKMTGNAESLNASIAAGICIYEMRKKLL